MITNSMDCLRGIDYRTVDDGCITFITGGDFSNRRDVEQAFGRVGRFGDTGVVVQAVKELINVDRALNLLLQEQQIIVQLKDNTEKTASVTDVAQNIPAQNEQVILITEEEKQTDTISENYEDYLAVDKPQDRR